MRHLSLRALALTICLAPLCSAQSAPERAEPYAIQSVRLQPGEDAPLRTILLAGGRIAAILDASEAIPPGHRTVDGKGALALPALIDTYTTTGCDTTPPTVERDRPVPVDANVLTDMREANRKGIQPTFAAIDVLEFGDGVLDGYRSNGFGALLSAPSGEILAGESALVTTRDAALRDLVVDGQVFQHADFRASGGGYPSTLMGYMAQLRQFLLDAGLHAERQKRFEEGQPGTRPVWDADLAAASALLEGEKRVVCRADSAADIERWVKLSDEFGFELAIAGGREAWRVIDLLRERKIPVILDLDWGDEVKDPNEDEDKKKDKQGDEPEPSKDEISESPESMPEQAKLEPAEDESASDEASEESDSEASEDAEASKGDDDSRWKYEEPLGVRQERRRLWEEQRDCALRLAEAEIPFSLGCGNAKPKELLKRARTAVEHGLDRDVAFAALTSRPAALLGVAQHFGSVEVGKAAAIALWTDHPLAEDAACSWLVVDGFVYEFEVKEKKMAQGAPAEGVDLTGVWTVVDPEDPGDEPMTMTLEMSEEGEVSGSIKAKNPMDQSDMTADVSGTVSGTDVSLNLSFDVGGMSVKVEMTGTIDGDTMTGDTEIEFPGGSQSAKFKGTREPQSAREGERS